MDQHPSDLAATISRALMKLPISYQPEAPTRLRHYPADQSRCCQNEVLCGALIAMPDR